MRHLTRALLCLAAVWPLVTTPAAAATVWTCTEDARAGDPLPGHASLFKLTISESKVTQTEDPFSRSLGGPSEQWTVIRDTPTGLVAVDGEARVLPNQQHAVGISVLLFDYVSERYAMSSFGIDTQSVASHGSCLKN
jgi:hypothetical protein